MPFKAIFRVEPASYFGTPEPGKTVVPADGGPFEGPIVHARTGTLVSHGTLSHYRSEKEAVTISLPVGSCSVAVRDNYFEVALEAADHVEALRQATVVVERVLRVLMVLHGDLYTSTPILLELPDGRDIKDPGPRAISMFSTTMYNLDELTGRLVKALAWGSIEDERIDRALLYYEHGRFLWNARGFAPQMSIHGRMLVSSSYLHLWKAISVILGEPGTDPDYQRRFLSLGLPKSYWKERIQPLWDIRCDDDVAHYSLDPPIGYHLEAGMVAITKVCKEVLEAALRVAARPNPISTEPVAG